MRQYTQSASQLTLVGDCLRAAGLRYNDRLYLPESEASEFRKKLGTKLHAVFEAYVLHGTVPDPYERWLAPVENRRTGETTYRPVYPGQVATAAFHLLRRGPSQDGLWVPEKHVKLPLPSGLLVVGFVDLWIAGQEFCDYKTTTDFRYCLLSDEEPPAEGKSFLRDDLQFQIYAWAWFAAHEDATHAQGHWIYLKTKDTPACKSVRARVTREENRKYIEAVDLRAQSWVRIRQAKTPGRLLPPTGLATGRCKKYTGCGYRGTEHCQITVEDLHQYGGMQMSVDQFEEILRQHSQQQQSRPAYWAPGDPPNEQQKYWLERQLPLSAVASMADQPPPPDVAATYDQQAPVAQADTPPALFTPAPAPAPTVEGGFVNPPESAGQLAFTQPIPQQQTAQAGKPAAQTRRAALKAQCVQLGLCDASSKLGEAGLEKLLARAQAPAPAPAPAPTPPVPAESGRSTNADEVAKRVLAHLADAINQYLIK